MNITGIFWFSFVYFLVAIRLVKRYFLIISLACVITLTLLASLATNTQYQQIKQEVLSKQISQSDYIEYLAMNGDQYNAQRVFRAAEQMFDPQTREKLNTLTYPKQSLLVAVAFWEAVRNKQPTSREALLALTVLNMQLKQQSIAKNWFEELKYIEPNDNRLQTLEKSL